MIPKPTETDASVIRLRVRFFNEEIMPKIQNLNCDGATCRHANGEVRLLPTGTDSNAILCLSCYCHELRWRKERNATLDRSAQFPLPAWFTLKVYATS